MFEFYQIENFIGSSGNNWIVLIIQVLLAPIALWFLNRKTSKDLAILNQKHNEELSALNKKLENALQKDLMEYKEYIVRRSEVFDELMGKLGTASTYLKKLEYSQLEISTETLFQNLDETEDPLSRLIEQMMELLNQPVDSLREARDFCDRKMIYIPEVISKTLGSSIITMGSILKEVSAINEEYHEKLIINQELNQKALDEWRNKLFEIAGGFGKIASDAIESVKTITITTLNLNE